MRQERGHGLPLRFPLSDPERTALKALILLLENPDSATDVLVSAFQQLNWELISAQSTIAWGNVHQFYFATLALRSDSTYAAASALSPQLAKFVYYIKYTCMFEALQRPADEAVG